MDKNGHKRTDLPVHMGEDLGEVFFSHHIAPHSWGFLFIGIQDNEVLYFIYGIVPYSIYSTSSTH